MKFLISTILGLGFISALTFYIFTIAPNPETQALASIMLFFYVAIPILIVSVAIGIVLQFRKQKVGSGNNIKIGKVTWLIIIAILLVFFLKFILPQLR